MIDLHSHLLPGIDDGARSTEQALSVLGQFVTDGVREVVVTPHLRASQVASGAWDDLLEERDRKLAALRAVNDGVPRLHAGFEIMLDEPLPAAALGDRRLSLAGSRYYLVEFPPSVVGEFAGRILHRMAATGVVPLVAHPERYAACSPPMVRRWREAGARMQVDATTLTRPTSRGAKARALVSHGLADVLAADNHGDRRTLLTAVQFLRARGGADGGQAAQVLTAANPQAVVRDRDLVDVPAVAIGERLLDRVKRFLKG